MTALEFLSRHRQSPFQLDRAACLKDLSRSAQLGLSGEGGLPMVLSYLTSDIRIPSEGSCYVMDAGGTNLRTALARFDDGICRLEDIRTIPMPASAGETLDAAGLYGRIAGQLRRFGMQERLGCCFSYLVDIERSLDGRLREWCKEVRCPDAVGRYVGRSLCQALPGCTKAAVLNDSTAALLGAKARLPRDEAPFLGLIMGTGVNICYPERRKKIGKLEADIRCRDMIISTEAGEFKGFAPGTFEQQVIDGTDDPRSAQAEKQCAGAYLAAIIACALREAAREGLLSRGPGPFDLADVSAFLEDPEISFAGLTGAEDLAFARELCALAVHRSAKIGAILTAEFVLRSAVDCSRVRIVAEGSLFWKMHGFRELFCRELEAITIPQGVSFAIERAEGVCLEGAAVAAFAERL